MMWNHEMANGGIERTIQVVRLSFDLRNRIRSENQLIHAAFRRHNASCWMYEHTLASQIPHMAVCSPLSFVVVVSISVQTQTNPLTHDTDTGAHTIAV